MWYLQMITRDKLWYNSKLNCDVLEGDTIVVVSVKKMV